MKFIRNAKGFTGLEIILVVVAIAAIGTAGYFAFEARSNAMNPKPESAPVKTEAKKDPYAGWQTFTSKVNGLTFKYPANWKNEVEYANDEGFKHETGKIVSPAGFELLLDNPPFGLGGGCEPENCPIIQTYSAEKQPQFKQATYLLKIHEYDAQDKNTITKAIGLFTAGLQTGNGYDPGQTNFQGFPPYLIFSNTDTDNGVWMRGAYPATDSKSKLGLKEYFELPDLKDAELVFRSVKLQ